MDGRGGLSSPRGWLESSLCRLAMFIHLLILAALNMIPPRSSTSSIWSISNLLNTRATAVFNVSVARCSLYNYLFKVFALLSGFLRRALDLDLSAPALLRTAASQPALTVVVEWPGSDAGASHPHAKADASYRFRFTTFRWATVRLVRL